MLLKASFSQCLIQNCDRKPHLISNPLYRHFITRPHTQRTHIHKHTHYLLHHGFTRIYFYDKFHIAHNVKCLRSINNISKRYRAIFAKFHHHRLTSSHAHSRQNDGCCRCCSVSGNSSKLIDNVKFQDYKKHPRKLIHMPWTEHKRRTHFSWKLRNLN